MLNTYAHNYRKLIAWQEAKSLVLMTYKQLKNFPLDEKYGLISQMKRAAVSVVSNIAEGNEKRSNKDKVRFFNIAQGSLTELECQLEISFELNFLTQAEYEQIINKVNRCAYLLTQLIKSKLNQ